MLGRRGTGRHARGAAPPPPAVRAVAYGAPAPVVRLWFRDDSTLSLGADEPLAVALRELAAALLARTA